MPTAYMLHLPSERGGRRDTNPITHPRNWVIKMKESGNSRAVSV